MWHVQRDPSLEVKLITGTSHVQQLVRVKAAAFKDYDLHTNVYPVQNEELMKRFNEERERLEMLNPSQVVVAVVDKSLVEPTIVAYSRWHLPSRVIREEQATYADSSMPDESESRAMDVQKSRPPPPEGTNIPLYNTFIESLNKMRSKYWNNKEDYLLGFLATHPDARGKGCASLLLQWGIQEAERHEAKIYLEATPMADGLYRKYQFYEVDEIKLSLVEYGKEETLSLKVMLRDSFMALEKGKGLGIR